MSKAKKIISMLLAIAMVLTVAPVSLLASAADDYTYGALDFTENDFTVSTSATEVIRVAAGANSFSLGNTIVAATPSGIPQSSGTYRDVAYAGETPSFPTVTFSITGKTLAKEPDLTITGAAPSKPNPVISTSDSTTTYTWTFTGGTATAGSDVVYQFDYTVGKTTYTSYAFSHVENIIVMNGFESYRDNAGSTSYSTDSTRHALIVQYQSKNMYTYMNPDQTNRIKGYINYAADLSGITSGSLTGCGSEDDFDGAANAYGSSVPNDSITGEEVAALIKSSIDSPDEQNGSWQNMCTAVDTNRGEPLVYLDLRNSGVGAEGNIAALNLRMTMQNADTMEFGSAYVSGVYFKNGHVAFGTNDSGFSNDTTAIQVASGTGSGNSITSSNYYGSVMVRFSGAGPTTISKDTDDDGNINETEYTVITAFYATRTNSGQTTRNYGAGGMHLDFITYDTTDLYGLIEGIKRGSGTYQCQTASFPNTTLTFNKGANPQEKMYASGWSEFIDAYLAANKVLVKPDTNQAEIDEVAANLWFKYDALSGYNETVNYEVKHVLNDGTNTEIIPAQTGTKPAGTTMVTYPASITGYEVSDKTAQTKDMSGNEATVTVTFKYDPVIYYVTTHSNASAGIKDIPALYDETIYKSSFEYGTKDYYTFDDWYYDKDVWEDRVPDSFSMPTNGVDVYAHWVPTPIVVECILMTPEGQELGRKEYSVTPNTDPAVSTPLARPDNDLPSHSGYLFVDFYDNFDAATGEFSNQTAWPKRFVIGDAGQTIYARMVNVSGKIVFETNGGNNIPDSTYTPPTQVNAPANPVKEGYDFAGWYKDSKLIDGPISWPVQMNDETGFIAYAAWTPQVHSISFDLGEPETKYDTKNENMPVLSGDADTVIPTKDYPPTPLKFGNVFDGWSLDGERFEFDGTATYPRTDIVLEPIWRATKYSAFADITAFEKLSGSYVETDTASVGDVVTFRMTTQTNFYTGSSAFVFMYDSNFFELVDEGADAFVLNKNNEYVSGINAKLKGVTDDSVLPWPEFERTVVKEDGSTAYYKAMMIAIDPTVSMTDYNCEPMSDGEWLIEFQLRVKSGATGEGKVFMDNAWTRTPDNIMGTMFYGWAETSDPDKTTVAETENSVVEPNLDSAYALINVDEVIPEDTTVILNSDGGTWSDGSTESLTYAGRAETEILDDAVPTRGGAATAIRGYASPEKPGYHLDETNPWLSAAGDAWAEGYYAAADKTGTEYVAQWVANVYEVNYYVDGNLIHTEEATYGELMEGPATMPAKQGYVFADWVDAETDGNVVDLTTATCPIDGLNLYATWAPADDTPYTIEVTYFNPVSGRDVETTVGMEGTTDATVMIVNEVPSAPAANTIYITVAELPTVANGNFVFDTANNTLPKSEVIKPDGSTVIELRYVGKTVTFTFDPAGGVFADGTTAPKTEVKTYNMQAAGPGANPTKDGYDFKAWSPTFNAGVTRMQKDTTYTATWTAKKYTATFDANGGYFDGDPTALTKPVEFAFGSTITAPATPTRAGYDFLGWSTDGSTVLNNGLGTMDTTDNAKVFIAVWALHDYTVNYYIDGEFAYAHDTAVHIGDVVTLKTAVIKDGYEFSGWMLDGEVVTTVTVDSSDVSVEGHYTPIEYKVNFDANGGKFADGSEIAEVPVYFDSNITRPEVDPTRNGHEFRGWATSKTSDTVITSFGKLTTTEQVTYYALWKALNADYKVETYYQDTTGKYPETTDNIATYSGLVGSIVNAATPDVNGFTLDTLNSTLSGTVNADEPLVLVVKYARNQYTATWTADGTLVSEDQVYYGAEITAPQAPGKDGYDFTGWSGYTEGDTMGTAAKSYTAVYTPKQYDVVWDVDGNKTTETNYRYGDKVAESTMIPTKTGYTFAGWAYDGKTELIDFATAAPTVPIGGIEFDAIWTVNNYTVTYRTYNGVYDTKSVAYNASLIYPDANPLREGYTFNGWLDNTGAALPATMPAGNLVAIAQWTINKYTVTYTDTYETTIAAQTDDYNTAISAVATPVRTGYTFNGWSWTKTETGEAITAPTKIPAYNVTAAAQWTINKYTVTYADTYETAIAAQTDDYGTAVTAVATPVRTGYSFEGWAWTKTESGEAVEAPATIPAYDVTATAQWTVNQYTVTYADTYETTIAAQTDDYGTAVNAVETPVRTGYTFNGWAWTNTKTGEAVNAPATIPAYDVTATAQWTINQYTVTYADTYETVIPAQTDDYGTAVNAVATPVRTGYTFNGWAWTNTKTGEAVNAPATIPAYDVTATAQWTINQYTVTYADTYETVIPAQTDDYGTAVNAVATPVRTGYSFEGWAWTKTGTDETVEAPATIPAYNVTATAQWTVNDYTITWTGEGVTTAVDGYDFGETIDVPEEPTRDGYNFAGWTWTKETADGETVASSATMPAYNVVATAQWTAKEYKVTWVVDEKSTEETYAYGAIINKPDDPTKTGYTFTGWSPEVPATQGIGDATYTAQWKINEYTVTWIIDGVTTTEPYDYQESINIKDDPTKEFYTFEGWVWTNTLSGEEITAVSEMPAYDVTITATFERVPVALKLVAESTAVVEAATNGEIVPGTESDPVYITGYIYGLETRLEEDELLAKYLAVEGDGRLEVTLTKYGVCGTGTMVEVIDNQTGEVVETYYIIIFGDINGDADLDSIDISMLEEESLGYTMWSKNIPDNDAYDYCKLRAGDITELNEDGTAGDGSIGTADAAVFRDVKFGLAEIDQKTGAVIY